MKIIHTFIYCKHCKEKIEVFDDEKRSGEKECEHCHYGNDLLYDFSIDYFYEEY